MKLWVRIDAQEKSVDVEERDGSYAVTVDGQTRAVDCRSAGHRDYLSLIIDNQSHLVECAPTVFEEGKYYASIGGRRYDMEVLDERLFATRKAAAVVEETGPYVVASPMPGLIVDVRVKVGDSVAAGSAVVVMEAMKMQNELVSEVDGVVRDIKIRTNDAVESQTPLVEIERTK